MKHERNHHGAVDKSFLEQQIRIVDVNSFFVRKIRPVHVAEPGLTARQAGGRRNTGEFGNF